MSYEYLAKVGRDLMPLVEGLRGLEVKVLHQVNTGAQAYDPALRREWEEALKRAENRLKQFATLRDRLEKQLDPGDDAAFLAGRAKVPNINVPHLEQEVAGLRERVGRHLTSLERLSTVAQTIDREKEQVQHQHAEADAQPLDKGEEQHPQVTEKGDEGQREQTTDPGKEEKKRLRAEAEVDAVVGAGAGASADATVEAAEMLEAEQTPPCKQDTADGKESTSGGAQGQDEIHDPDPTAPKPDGKDSDSLLDVIDSISDQVVAGLLAPDKPESSAPSRATRSRPQKERKPRERRSPPVDAATPAALTDEHTRSESQVVVSEADQPPVIDDEMEELRLRLQRLEQDGALDIPREDEQELAEKTLQDDFERGLAQHTPKKAVGGLHTSTSRGEQDSASYSGSNTPRDDHQIPFDPITPRTKKDFERPDRDEEDGDELPEDKAGEREIKYLSIKKKPILTGENGDEEEEQKITFHEGEPPAYHRGGYLKRLERKAIVKHKWQTRWMRLDSQYLSVYGSAAEASKDKSGKLALQQYRLYDLEEVALARNIHGMEIAFKLRFNDRHVLLSASTKNLMAKWMLAIDSVAHRRNYNETESAFISKLSQRDVCLRRLYLPVTEDGTISCCVDNVEYKWRYKREENSPVGELVNEDATCAYTWDAEYLRPVSNKCQNWGYGVWDGIWLTWYSSERRFVMRYQWHSAIEEFHFVSANPTIKTTFIEFPPFRYNGKLLLSSDRTFSWRVRGNKVPPPVVLSLQILYYQQNAPSC